MALVTYLLAGAATLFVVSRILLRVDLRFAFVLVLLPLIFTGEALMRGAAYAPADIPLASAPLESHQGSRALEHVRSPALSDVATLMIPWREAVRAAYARGEWPLWNPSILCGDILAAASEPAPYHPVRLLSMVLDPASGITFEASMTLLLAALAMFLMLRGRGFSDLSSLTGAVVWMFSDFLTFYLEYPMGSAVSMLPFLIFSIDALLTRELARGFFSLTAGFVLVILSGHPESTLHVVAIAAVYFLVRLLYLRPDRWLRRSALGILSGLGAVGICALFLLPFLEALPQTFEYSFRMEHETSARRSVDLNDAARRMAVTFFPSTFGDDRREVPHARYIPGSLWSGFAGILPLVLGLIAVIGDRRRALPWIFVLSAGLLAGSRFPVVMEALDLIPLFDIALNDRLIFLVPFALAVLSAIGISLLESGLERGRQIVVAGLALYATSLLALAPFQLASGLSRQYVSSEIVNALCFCVVAAFGVYMVKRTDSRVVLLISFLLFESAARRADFHPVVDRADFYPSVSLLRRIQNDPERARIVASEFNFVPNVSAMYGIDDARGFEGMTFGRLYETFELWSVHQPVWFNRVDDLSPAFLSMVNVRYAIVSDHFTKRNGWQVVARDGRSELLRNPRTLPRAFVPRNVRFERRDKSVKAMHDVIDFSETSIIESDEDEGVHPNGPASVTVARNGSGYLLRVTSANPVWIIVSESAWAGWRASAGKANLPLRFGNHAFLALEAPAGESEIDLRYAPRSFFVGLLLSGITLAIFLGSAVALRMRSRA